MDIHEIGNLLERIMVHYPTFEKQVIKDGKLSRAVGEEWHRLIGFLDYDEALARLDAYMEDADNKRPPMAMDFKRVKPRKNSEIFQAPIEHEWKIVNGRLYDQEDREYVVDPTNELPFYYDKEGNICQGKIIRFYHRTKSERSPSGNQS